MATATAAKYLEIIEQLVPETPVVFHNVSWEEYEQLHEAIGERPVAHISFDSGTMEIMSISTEHGYFAGMLSSLIRLAVMRLNIRLRSFGSATISKKDVLAGKEPDGCYYLKSLALIGSRIDLNFEHDPPPDIAIELDFSGSAIPKLPIYQRLGLAEVWLYDGDEMTIYRLSAQGYESIARSLELPCFTGELLTEFMRAIQSPDDDNQLLKDYVERIVRT